MIWYNLRKDDGTEIKVDDQLEATGLINNGYTLMSVIDTEDTSKCKEG